MSGTAPSYDEIMLMLRGEFIDEAVDNLNELDIMLENLRSGQESAEEGPVKICRIAHSLKGSSGVAGFPLVSMVMHRMEDYLSEVKATDESIIDDLQIYIDKARELVSDDADDSAISSEELARDLPQRGDHPGETAGVEESSDKKVEAMMIMNEKTVGRLFKRELIQSGLRVGSVDNAFHAIELAVRTKPDIVIASAVLDGLSGIDLACAIRAMPSTSAIPIAVLTSYEAGDPHLAKLPEGVAIIRKSHVKDDLAKTLEAFKLA